MLPTTSAAALPDRLASEGRSVPMPSSNAEIVSLLLHLDSATRARSLVVQFPAGFARLEPGRYTVGEEFYVLTGALHLNDRQLSAGDWCWVPPSALRAGFRSEQGAVVYAWFSGRNDFVPASNEQDSDESGVLSGQLTGAAADLVLRDGAGSSGPGCSALLKTDTPVTGPAEIFELDSCRWSRLEPLQTHRVEGSAALVRWDNP